MGLLSPTIRSFLTFCLVGVFRFQTLTPPWGNVDKWIYTQNDGCFFSTQNSNTKSFHIHHLTPSLKKRRKKDLHPGYPTNQPTHRKKFMGRSTYNPTHPPLTYPPKTKYGFNKTSRPYFLRVFPTMGFFHKPVPLASYDLPVN